MHVAEAGCLYLFRADVKPPPEKENAKMLRGKAMHQDIEAALSSKSHVAAYAETLSVVQWAREQWNAWEVEVPIGIDPTTGSAARYPDKDAIPQNHVAVVVDVIGFPRYRNAEVYDWKTGSQFSKFDYTPQAKLNGFAVAALYGADEINTGLAYPSESGVTPKTWSLDEFDLAHQRQKLRVWAEQAPTAEPNPNPSCRYCPARAICPAQIQVAG